MKNIYSTIAVAAAALMLSGCVKDSFTNMADSLVFTASIENEDTKTALAEGNRICWEAGDEISINGTIYTAAPDAANATTATFTKKDESAAEPTGTFTAVYPAGIYVNGGFALPATQTLDAGNSFSGINPMYAQGTSTSLTFKNLCGVLELSLKGSTAVRSINVTDAEQALSGAFTVNESTEAVLTDEANAAKCGVTLDCGDGAAICEEGTSFYIAIPAGSYTALSITVSDVEGKTFTANLREGVTATVQRSKLYTIELTPEFSALAPASGIFTVNTNGRKIQFASGNLYFDGADWAFEAQQSDYAEAWSADHVSHFFWTKSNYGASDSYTAADAETLDWGAAFCESKGINAGEWSTLTSDEWNFLLNRRGMTNGKPRYSNAVAAPVTIDGKQYSGLFVYPDDYAGNVVDGSFSWSKINADGIVFLPAAGRRSGTSLNYCGAYGYYWASDSYGKLISRNLCFGTNGVYADYAFGRYAGYCVRLVTDAE